MQAIKTPSGNEIELGPLVRDLPYMVRSVNALLRPEGEAVRQQLGFEAGMIGILSIIWLNPGISQNDVAAAVVLKKSSVAKLVKTLEASGFVTRRRADDDRRMNALTLTETGAQAVGQIRMATEAVNDRLFEGITAQDRDIFHTVLSTLLGRMLQSRPANAPDIGSDPDRDLADTRDAD